METHSSILALETPWNGGAWGLQSMGLPKVRHDLAAKHPPTHTHTHTHTHENKMVDFMCGEFCLNIIN